MMTTFEIVSVALRSAISDVQVNYLERLIARWQRVVYGLDPTLPRQICTSSLTSATIFAASDRCMGGGSSFLKGSTLSSRTLTEVEETPIRLRS